MLQIVTKMYFDPQAEVHTTTHRRALYTNLVFLGEGRDRIELPVGTLIPENGLRSASVVMFEVDEHIEKATNESFGLIATGGGDLVDDLAAVVSFGLNAVFNRRADLVQRLVGEPGAPVRRDSAGILLRRTFEPQRFVQDIELEQLRDFMTDLLALERPNFERAMRAIRHVVGATQNAIDDPTGSYAEMVEALESLADKALAPKVSWSQYDPAKAALLDTALASVEESEAEKIREAVLEADKIGVTSQFVHSTISRIGPEYFRAEAIGANGPLRRQDLERALKLAYKTRSQKSHVLRDLPQEVWLFTGSETHRLIDGQGTILTLEGLWRLVRHVIRRFVRDAPKAVTADFNWRASLPGQATVRLAPQYWAANPYTVTKEGALELLGGVSEMFVDIAAGRSEGMTDLRPVLSRIEEVVPSLHSCAERDALVAIYWMWHNCMALELHQPRALDFLGEYGSDAMTRPSVIAFLARTASGGGLPDWTAEEYAQVAESRHEMRSLRRHFQFPAQFDAALQLEAADRLEAAGEHERAIQHAAYAVEEAPGNELLIEWEAKLVGGNPDPKFPLPKLIFGVDRPAGTEELAAE